ncbi:uncharacterized protein LOC106656390 [Trichogramma pretiosum]|uniref:uncharacterized protein LOC106656390 n=1 Tax=Trichogramma pretiosum TaxID=7493 RepID=UPI0006C9E114|nr:uncharacterized protein LOC106656390 [Trichogramma pretiosum]
MDKRLENLKPGRLFSMESNIYYNFHLLRLMCIDPYMKESLRLPVNIIILTTYLLTILMTIVVLVKAIIKNETNINLIMEMSFTCIFTVDMMSYYIILLKYNKEEKYFYLLLAIVIVINALMIVESVLLLSANIMIIKYLEGLFDFMSYSVNHMYDNLNPIMIKMSIKTSNKEIRRNIINLIKCYQQSIQIFNLFSTFTRYNYFIVVPQIALNIIFLGSKALLEISHDLQLFGRLIIICLASFLVLPVLIYPCQQLINANERFRNECYACKWYKFSPEARRLLLGLTFRASHYFVLKAGPIISMTMETCSTILKTSLTYLVTVNKIYSSFGEK